MLRVISLNWSHPKLLDLNMHPRVQIPVDFRGVTQLLLETLACLGTSFPLPCILQPLWGADRLVKPGRTRAGVRLRAPHPHSLVLLPGVT